MSGIEQENSSLNQNSIMNDIKLPKVLVIGINAWREDGTAHTLMDIFRCWDPDRLALVYARADLPDTDVCKRYFQISENQIVGSILKPWKKVGRIVENTHVVKQSEVEAEHARYTQAHKKSSSLLPLLREIVWKFGHWKTPALKKFVLDFNPDIIFIPIYPVAYMGRIQRYIAKLTGKPTVCYLADDNYSYDSCQNLCSYINRFWLRHHVGPIARNCKDMFVIVEKEKEDTDRRFGTDSKILTKSIDFNGRTYVHRQLNNPLRFIYTGSMIIGRDRTLALVSDAINEVNRQKGEVKAEMFIYSQTEPCDRILRRINIGASHFCGRISRDEVLKVQQEADVVIFAEALDGKEANVAKLSFSTKITDYISNGKCVLAIGRDYIAPIDYFQRNDAAIIAHSPEEIVTQVNRIVDNPTLIDEYGRKAFDCAVRNHEKDMMIRRFIGTMLHAVGQEYE